MKIHFLSLTLAALALCCISAAAPSAQKASDQEVAMAKCTKTSDASCSSDNTSNSDQSNASSKVTAPRKSAAQKVVEGQ